MKRKQVISLIVTSAMLFSGMGMAAAAQPIEWNVQSAMTVDTESSTLAITVEEDEEETKKETEGETEPEAEESTEEETEETEEETEEETGEETEKETEEEPEEETGEETEKETEEETGEETEEETGEETEEETGEETEEEPEEETEEETGEETEEETEEAPENLKEKLPEVQKHSWSADWSYDETCHWHECEMEDCLVADDSEKDGYAEHSYNDDGICTECGYDSMDGIAVAAQGDIPTYQEAYEIMIALKGEYPEGMTWTNFEPYGSSGHLGSAYTWKGGAIYGAKSAVGCMAFAFILSDEVFGNLPARAIERGNFKFEDVKVGDILRVEGNSHSVIVLQKTAGGVTVAEANYKKTVHWGRAMSASAVENADFIITRYPKGYVPSVDQEDEVAVEGTEGSLNWSLTDGGVLTISGNGAIPDYSPGNAPWSGYDFYTVVIDEGVTGIGEYAFYQSEALSVYIPDSVTDIGQNAFRGSALLAVTVPGKVKTIGDGAFYDCKNLTSVTVSQGVAHIGDNAFNGCTTLAYIDFPASIRSVGAGAFGSCDMMVSVRFMPGSGNVTLGDGLFRACQHLTRVTLPQTADSISAYMFQSCTSLETVYIPASVKSIGENPFTSCRSLKFIYFGGSEAEWKAVSNPQLEASLKSTGTTVVFDAAFDDPFATDPNDPGDFLPGGNESCTNHIDADGDGKCDNCGAAVPVDKPESGDKPESSGRPESSGKPESGGNSRPSAGGSSGNYSGGDSSGSYSGFGGSGGLDGTGNPIISTVIRRGEDGSRIVSKTHRDGTVVTTTTNAAGKIKMEAKLSASGIRTAEQNGEAVALPIPAVRAVKDVSMASAITVHTQKDQPVKVAIPVALPAAGVVAVIVNEDGSTTVMKDSVPTKDSVVVSLPNGATIKIVDNSKSFSDVPAESGFLDAVSFISARELFYGTTETTFAPDAPMTYAVLTTALARFDGVQTDGGATWYEKSMEWASARGIKDGTNPDSSITFQQLVTLLWKYQGSPVDAALSGDGAASQLSEAEKAMQWALKNGIVNGFEDGTFDPQKKVNRAQAAQIIMNFAKNTAKNF